MTFGLSLLWSCCGHAPTHKAQGRVPHFARPVTKQSQSTIGIVRMNGQTILLCDYTYHSTRCQYDAELLDNATQANSWLQVEIQWHSGSLFYGRVAAMHLRVERREEFLILHDQWENKAKVPLELYEWMAKLSSCAILPIIRRVANMMLNC